MGSLMEYRRRILLNTPHLETVSGSVAHFTTDMAAKLKECRVNFLPLQAGSGDPSPSNVRAISGWTGCDVVRSGKNLARVVRYSAQTMSSPTNVGELTNNYGTTINTRDFVLPDTPLVVTQLQSNSTIAKHNYRNGYITVNPDNLPFDNNRQYIVSFRVSNVTNNPLNADLSDIKIINPYGTYYSSSVDGDKLIFTRYKHTKNSNRPNMHSIDIRICGMSFTLSEFMITPEADTDYTWEPYNGNQITVSWDNLGTIYGGYIDVLRGELVATYGFKRIVGNESWIMSGGISGLCAYRPTLANFVESQSGYSQPICDKLKGVAEWGTATYRATINSAGNFYFGAPEELSTSEAVNAWVQSIGGIDVAYPLATPITYPLSPEIIKAIKGVNNVWSDAGDVSVKFWTH